MAKQIQKKLNFVGDAPQSFIVTKRGDKGGIEQERISLYPGMSDALIRRAVEKGVPVNKFEAMKGWEDEYKKLESFRRTMQKRKVQLTKATRVGLVDKDGNPTTIAKEAEKYGKTLGGAMIDTGVNKQAEKILSDAEAKADEIIAAALAEAKNAKSPQASKKKESTKKTTAKKS